HPTLLHSFFPYTTLFRSHRVDVIGAIHFLLDHPEISGPVNVVAPHAVSMREFCRALGKAMHRPSRAKVPAPILRVLLGEMAEMIDRKSTRLNSSHDQISY